jgi:nucleoside-diphosphate-sugar epimerase
MSARLAAYTAYALSPAQKRVKDEGEAGKYGKAPPHCVVTGGSGFVGQRLVEMLVERGAQKVVSFDVVPASENVWKHPAIEYVTGDLRDLASVEAAIKGADCVWHNGAAVGPYHPEELYHAVNVVGTANVISACRKYGVTKLVFSSSPSTRFGPTSATDPDGATEEEMPSLPQATYVQEYAKTKAEAELMVRAACSESLLTIAVAPHQVYGPRDNLFLPNILEVSGLGKLRVFGPGRNRICFTHVDNYAHALVLGEKALTPGNPALGKFYIATDGHTHPHPEGYCVFWEHIDSVITDVGFKPIRDKYHLPAWLMMFVGWLCQTVGGWLGLKPKLSCFSVRMLLMNRWFRISAIERDLGYKPVVGFQEGWADTVCWFREYWLPHFGSGASGLAGGVAKQTQHKIDLQSGGKKAA